RRTGAGRDRVAGGPRPGGGADETRFPPNRTSRRVAVGNPSAPTESGPVVERPRPRVGGRPPRASRCRASAGYGSFDFTLPLLSSSETAAAPSLVSETTARLLPDSSNIVRLGVPCGRTVSVARGLLDLSVRTTTAASPS